MKILFLNRRDIKNPDGGGAEIYTHEIARGLVEKYSCMVSVFSSHFISGEKEEIVDGVRYIRKGNEFTVHLWGFFYAVKHRRELDLVIDEFNGIGFFTFFLQNSILLIHQLYKEFWFRELSFVGAIPYVLEPILLRLYSKKPTITVSNSTRQDLERIGFANIDIVMNAIKNNPVSSSLKKSSNPTLVFLGRLKSTKRPEDAIEIYKRVKMEIPDVRLWMIGRGPDEERLKLKANRNRLGDITFWGQIEDEKKMELLKDAHILLAPGVREGFGINVIEAASAGTPSVGYNIHGLRDSIIHGETGFLVNNVNDAVGMVKKLLDEREFYRKISQNCLNYAKDFNWGKRVEEFWQKICKDKSNGK